MLNKNICMSCIKNNRGGVMDRDDVDWKRGIVYCPLFIYENGKIAILENHTSEEPPEFCGYKLEHIIENQK